MRRLKTMASSYKTPPSFVSDTKTYSQWVAELTVWRQLTELAKAKQALANVIQYFFWTDKELSQSTKTMQNLGRVGNAELYSFQSFIVQA